MYKSPKSLSNSGMPDETRFFLTLLVDDVFKVGHVNSQNFTEEVVLQQQQLHFWILCDFKKDE